MYYTDRKFIDEPQISSVNEKILLDKKMNSDSSIEKVLTEAFSGLKLDADGNVACVLSFEHLDEFVLENEKKMPKKDMEKILDGIDSIESHFSVVRSHELYERSMRNLDKMYDAPFEDDADDQKFILEDYHGYGCECEKCTQCRKELEAMEEPSGDFSLTDEELRRDRCLLMKYEREERLNEKRSTDV